MPYTEPKVLRFDQCIDHIMLSSGLDQNELMKYIDDIAAKTFARYMLDNYLFSKVVTPGDQHYQQDIVKYKILVLPPKSDNIASFSRLLKEMKWLENLKTGEKEEKEI